MSWTGPVVSKSCKCANIPNPASGSVISFEDCTIQLKDTGKCTRHQLNDGL